MSNVKLLLRRSEARERLGVSEQVFTKLVTAGRVKAIYLTRGGRAFYAASAIESLTQPPTPNPKTK